MTDIEILYHKIYTNNSSSDFKFFIEAFESNRELIEGADPSITNPDYDGIMRLTSDYALSLSSYGSSIKAMQYLEKAILLFQNSSTNDLTKVPIYEMLIFTRGMENFNIKKYSIAAKDFEFLVSNYPENDKYRDWLLAAKTYKSKKLLNNLWYIVLFCFLCLSFVKREDKSIRELLLWVGIISCSIASIIEINNYLVKRKVKNRI